MRTKTALAAAGTIASITIVAAVVAYRQGVQRRGYRGAEFDREPTSFDELIEHKRVMMENDRRKKMRRLEMQTGVMEAMRDIGDDFEGTPAELFDRARDAAEERTADGEER